MNPSHMRAGLVSLMLGWVAAGSGAAEVSQQRLRDVSLTLQRLCEVQALSSHEAPLTRRIRSILPPGLQGEVDDHGNLMVTLGSGEPMLTFVAHQDEIGYEIRALDPDGRALVTRKGGFYEFLYEGHAVVVGTVSGAINAVFAPRANYQETSVAREGVTQDDLRLDFGTDTKAATEALGVRVGDPVTVPKSYARLAATRASARSMDDRVGCAALLLALEELKGARLNRTVRFVFSTEEEIGLKGAEAVAKNSPGTFCFAVDTFVSSDSPLESSRFALAALGDGCVLRAVDQSGIAARADVEKVLRLAREARVAVQVGITGGGDDGSKFVEQGTPNLALS